MKNIKAIFLLALIHSCCILQAQTQTPRNSYSLLWKISGNGIKEPSYLFGTMHLTDKKVFDFSDSVLVSLNKCQAFAMEITPDSILPFLFNSLLDDDKEDDGGDQLSKVLTPEEYNKLDKKLKDEMGISISQLKIKNASTVNTLLKKTVKTKGNKSTFLDAYLYRLSKQNKKKIIGLEYSYEHIDALDKMQKSSVEELKYYLNTNFETDKRTNDLLNIYYNGDIKAIHAAVSSSGGEEFMLSIYDRNINMADRTAEQIRLQSTFIAVGAAHLWGGGGMIALLKEKGFEVTPVKATFTGMAAKYKEIPLTEEWETFTSEEQFFSIETPSTPYSYKKIEDAYEGKLKVYMYPDLSSGTIYMLMTVNINTAIGKGKEEETLDKFMDRILSNKKYVNTSSKKIIYDGYPAREFETFEKSRNSYMKGRLILRNSIAYLILTAINQKELLVSKDITRYLNSLKILKYKPSGWNKNISIHGAYDVLMPGKPKEISKKIPNADAGEIKVTLLNSKDLPKNIEYLTAFYEYEAGTTIPNDSAYFESVIFNLSNLYKGEVTSKTDFILDGYAAKEFYITTADKSYSPSAKGRLVIRGSRPYMMLTSFPEENKDDQDITNFFNSFTFTGYEKQPAREKYVSEEKHNFTFSPPSEITIDIDSTDAGSEDYPRYIFNTVDKASGQSYIISVDQYPPYYYMDRKEFFKSIKDDYIKNQKDFIVKERISYTDKQYGEEYEIKSLNTKNILRIKINAIGDKVYQLFGYIPEKDLHNTSVDSIFASFHFTDTTLGRYNNIFKGKCAKLLKDASSNDTTINKEARRYINSYKFDKKDLPEIYSALLKTYDDDTSNGYFSGTRTKLLSILQDVNDESTFEFIKKQYNTFSAFPFIQGASLEALSYLKTKKSIQLFEELTKKGLPAVDYMPYDILYPLNDSLDLAKEFYPSFFEVSKNILLRSDLYTLTTKLIDSSKIKAELIYPYINLIKENFTVDSLNYVLKKEDVYPSENISNAASLLKHLGQSTEAINILNKISQLYGTWISLEAVKSLLINNSPIDKKALESIAKNNTLRLDLYETLKASGKSNLFPAQYLKQELFAESDMMKILSYDDSSPDSIVLIGNKKIKTASGEVKYYLFKFLYNYEENPEWYTGISGPFPVKTNEILTSGEITNTKYETLKSKSIKEHYNSLINNFYK